MKKSDSVGVDLWRTLAIAGSKSTADSLSAAEISALHVDTGIEDFLKKKVDQGFSVVLTGNAGDGKTHAIRRLEEHFKSCGAVVVTDATAKMRQNDVKPLLEVWTKASENKKPLCMAANEYPLYQLRKDEKAQSHSQIAEVSRQCLTRLAYGTVELEEQARESVIVVDFSLRNPLTPRFVDAVLNKVLSNTGILLLAKSNLDPILSRNFARMSQPQVQLRIKKLFERMVALGYRATVRELWILICRALFSPHPKLRDTKMADWYSEVFFQADDRFAITKALAEVDPANFSNPQIDAMLEGEPDELKKLWRTDFPAITPQVDLTFETFKALKRAFYFEHEDGAKVFNGESDADSFIELLDPRREDDLLLKEKIIGALNSVYCPKRLKELEENLYLWCGHRYHEQPTRSFVAGDRISKDRLAIELPRLPSRLEGAFDYQPNHLSLVYRHENKSPIRLLIDFPLYKTIQRLSRGLPRKLVPERHLHRIDAFLEALGGVKRSDRRTLWSAHLEHVELIEIVTEKSGARYAGVKRYG